MSHKEKLSGVFPPFMTPFSKDGEVLYDKLAENIEKYNETDLRGYMPLGSNGEFMSLTEQESLKIRAYAHFFAVVIVLVICNCV